MNYRNYKKEVHTHKKLKVMAPERAITIETECLLIAITCF